MKKTTRKTRPAAKARSSRARGSTSSQCYIEVQIYGGASIDDATADAVKLAKRLGITVWFEFNGKQVLARPTDDPVRIAAGWHESVDRGWSTASQRSNNQLSYEAKPR